VKNDIGNIMQLLDRIIDQAVEALEKGKAEIFDITENARQEMERLKEELEDVKEKTKRIIEEVDRLEKMERDARFRLMVVSKDLKKFTEEDIREAYGKAKEYQVQLILKREEEKQLRARRDDLERRLNNLIKTIQKAENLISHIGLVMKFLKGDLKDLTTHLEGMHKKQLLGVRIIKAQEEERRRVARDIHDGPAQSIANVIISAEVCEKLLEEDLEKAKEELKILKEKVRAVLKELRKIIFDLRPMALDDLGLIPVLKRYIKKFETESGIKTQLTVLGEKKRLPSPLEVSLFRIIQEALSNIEKHSRASYCQIKLEIKPNRVNAVVKDNGIGFNVEKKLADVYRDRERRFGLLGMNERAELVGGTVSIRSKEGKGTRVFVNIPIKGKGVESYESDQGFNRG